MMIIVGILLFALLVVIHELGHFWVARRNGVEVEEFGIGFPPRILSREHNGTLYSLNLLPLGGFVKMKGESDSDKRPGSLGSKSLWSKAKILLAGVGMNIVAAFAIILVLALTQLPSLIPGQYNISDNQTIVRDSVMVGSVVDGSPAQDSGIQAGDELITVADRDIESANGLVDITEELAGELVVVEIVRDGDGKSVEVVLDAEDEDGSLGVAPVEVETSRYTWAAPLIAVGLTGQMIWLVLTAVGDIFIGLLTGAGADAAQDVAGPVGIVAIFQGLSDVGLSYLFFLMATISVSLAVFNALPIPALDGGRLALILGARLAGRSLSEKVESAVHGIGFMALIGLLILITYVDIQRFF